MNKTTLHNIRREIVLTLAYPFLWGMLLFLWLLPKAWRGGLIACCGKLYYRYGKKARLYALDNLTLAYGNSRTPEQIERMAQEVFHNVAGAFIDFFATVLVNRPQRFFKMVTVRGENHLQEAFDRQRGVICLIPHLSAWELSAVTPGMLGFPTKAASKAIKSWCIQRTMVWFRARRGMYNFSRENSYQKLVESLRQGDCIILMIDQDTKVKGCFVDFFGHQAYTPLGAARLAMETGAAVVPMAMTRNGVASFCFDILPELPLVDTGNREADLVSNTQRQTTAMEQFIAQTPTQWVWMHRRWRTTPESLERYRQQKSRNQSAKL
ncbi:MAG: hypothetical protein LBS16_05355 [Prevotellaceae bacterium]|jgi:KDO2-lipid IV(A) lauroyltransferase|nr:hypothetical protein [Prevotellaceae bacterium]